MERHEVFAGLEVFEVVQEVKNLTEILKLVKLPDPNNHLMALLHFVSHYFNPSQGDYSEWNVTLICSDCSQHFQVVPEGFELLEHIETTFGSTKQSIEEVYIVGAYNSLKPQFLQYDLPLRW